ncbi:7026_t:CDS:2, partial [Acaulospora morrowiae]
KWPENNKFTYGYGRIETLSGFANGIFLVLVSIFIVFEAIGRLLEPPEMNTDKLLLVSFVGLIVNLIVPRAKFNPRCMTLGIYLHILADTLGSVGVIVSTILIQKFGWTGFDPLASLLIAGLIFASVLPLIKHSASVLMLSVTGDLERNISEGLHELLHIPNINSYTMPRFWLNDAECIIGSIHVQTTNEANEQATISEVTKILKSHINGLEELTVQVEKTGGFQGCFCNSINSNVDRRYCVGIKHNIEVHNKRKNY